ncbi:MAG: YfbK domain-containing protein, partial [Planctomycetota bacterium]
GSVRTVLNPTSAQEKETIKQAIMNLQAGGSTAMASGILNAYSLANVHFNPQAVNRVIICSDGDANVGSRNHNEVLALIEDYKNKGITLSTIGFGMGNYQDTMMEQLADKGNGNYSYVDKLSEAKRIFVEQMTGTLQVIAKDMKVQVEFNPETVKSYRLIGYENREVQDKDFRNDQVDGGEVGSGHTVTALYELELTPQSGRLCHVFVRAKQPDGQVGEEVRYSYEKEQLLSEWNQTSKKFRFIACVAEMAEILRESPHVNSTLEAVYQELQNNKLAENEPEQEFVQLVQKALALKGSPISQDKR